MDDKRRSDTFKSPSNPLLSAARGGFTFDDLGGSPLLVPVSETSSSVLPNDAGAAAALPLLDGHQHLHDDHVAGTAAESASLAASAPPVLEPSSASPAAPTAGYGGFPSISTFTSSWFSSPSPGPSPTPPFQPPPPRPESPFGPPGAPAGPLEAPSLDDSFQPVPLEPATGPTPTFYNPGSISSSPLSLTQTFGGLALSSPTTPSVRDSPRPSTSPLSPAPRGPPSSIPGPPSTFSPGPHFTAPPSGPTPPTGFTPGPPSGPSGPPLGLPLVSTSGPPRLSPGPAPVAATLYGPPSGPGPSVVGPSGPPGPPPGPSAAGSNAFRLGGRRPVYAPVPGLETLASPSSANAPMPMAQGVATMNPVMTQDVMSTPSPSPATPATPSHASPSAFSSETFNNGDHYQPQSPPVLEYSPLPMYRTVYQHWFFKKEVENKVFWQPFSMSDSLALESHFLSPDLTIDTEVPTDGGRYDVNILRRQRAAVYWEEAPTEVRRCSWFYKGNADSRYVPYDENVATRLEEEYKQSYTLNEWQKRVEFPNGEAVVFHSANAMVHYLTSSSPDAWGNTPGTQHRPRVVKRGVDEFDIESGESETVDHLLFLVHGIGSACDLKFRSVVEVVDDFRRVSQQLIESHFSASVESGKARRVEVLPVSWHARLHSEDIERQLRSITLPSIPMLRHLTNDALIDILFYTSPIYCQTIIQTVAKELNRLHALFLKRNPDFQGGVSLGGHSLGSLILFDLLWHQKGDTCPTTPINSSTTPPPNEPEEIQSDDVVSEKISEPVSPMKRKLSQKISYVMMGPAGTGQPFISYPQLVFHPENFFALGSPIGVFVTVRGIDSLGEDFALPTCPAFFNIFHPYDLVAYRIETLIKPDMENVPPVLIPHHKGRKRMHIELRETVARMGADLKQKVLDSVRNTWNSVYQLAMFHRSNESLTEEMNQVLEDEIRQQSINCSTSNECETDMGIIIGKLNGGRRIDYVLQEAPLESFNEYLFAIGSHVCYWKSEDTMLLMLKEMYRSAGVNVDSQVPQQQVNPHLVIPPSATTTESYNLYSQSLSPLEPALLEPSPLFPSPSHSTAQQIIGMDPTAPPSDNRVVGPPPVTGFYRK